MLYVDIKKYIYVSVHHYVVSVYTGKEMGAETDAPVYITVHGQYGDWGKRYLIHSNNNKKFRTGQVLSVIQWTKP